MHKTSFTCTLATIDGVVEVATGTDTCEFDDVEEGEYTVTAAMDDVRSAAAEQWAVFPLHVDTTFPRVKV